MFADSAHNQESLQKGTEIINAYVKAYIPLYLLIIDTHHTYTPSDKTPLVKPRLQCQDPVNVQAKEKRSGRIQADQCQRCWIPAKTKAIQNRGVDHKHGTLLDKVPENSLLVPSQTEGKATTKGKTRQRDRKSVPLIYPRIPEKDS